MGDIESRHDIAEDWVLDIIESGDWPTVGPLLQAYVTQNRARDRENEALKARLSEAKAQRDAALAEMERLRTVKLPEITEEIAKTIGAGLIDCSDCECTDLEWGEDAINLIAVINKERSK